MSLREQHIQLITKVARALGDLNQQAVYVGGAVVSFYVDDPAARDVRPTDDVDITLEITSQGRLEALRQQLIERGFKQSPEDDILCRFRYEGTKVDVMSTREVGWAPANPWFEPGFNHLETETVDGIQIQILSIPYFLASKISAFRGRAKDPRTSHDLEDVTYVLDNRTDLVEVLKEAPEEVLNYLTGEFEQMLEDRTIKEAIIGNLEYGIQAQRFEILKDKLEAIIDNQ